jgi:NitT/TauT family transport system substrate-binding protein
MAAGLAAAFGAAHPAIAETDTVRIARQYSLAALPLMVIEKRKLLEKRAIAAGLDQVKVQWLVPDKSGAVDTLLNGNADLAPVSVGHFLAAWDRKLGTPQEMRALAPLVRVPYVLVTRNAAIKTIRDFTDRDRIAVPAIKFSGPALMLEMAAAQEWGAEHYDRLDDRVRSLSDPQASAELRDGKSDLDAHFSRSPYVDDELGTNAIHRVMDSYDIAGPHSDDLLVGLVKFQQANPRLCAAIFGALQDADEMISKNPGEAAEIYISLVGDREITVEDFSDIIGDPDVAFTVAPAGVGRLADFMARIKRIKHRPDSWKDLFFPEAQATPGG